MTAHTVRLLTTQGSCKKLHEAEPKPECQVPRIRRASFVSPQKGAKDSKGAIADPTLLYDIPLIPVKCDFSKVREHAEQTLALQPTIDKQRRSEGCKITVVFAIRRPGCGNCREHGLQLTEISRLEPDVSFIGIMKHGVGVEEANLLQFFQKYYRFPLYKDKDWRIYKAMGGRKISIWKTVSTLTRLLTRYKKKGIPNGLPTNGDHWTKGGVLIFDKENKVRHMIYEKYGKMLDMDEIHRAIQNVRETSDARTHRSISQSSESNTSDSSNFS